MSAAAEAKAAGYGGIAAAARATKVARSTIGRGLKDLQDPGSLTGKVRRKGGGSPRLTSRDPTLLEDLQRLLEPATMGDPMRLLRWVSKSHDKLAAALRAMGHKVRSSTIPKLLEELKYCRHFNRKTKEGGKHPDRDAQFEYINAKAEAFQAVDQPVISIDAKKKELLGEFKNGGSDYGPQGQPIEVNTHDFEDKELGKFIPYGIYDTGANLGYVSLGIDHDTGQFAVNGVRLWLDRMGRERYPSMTRLMITADGGGLPWPASPASMRRRRSPMASSNAGTKGSRSPRGRPRTRIGRGPAPRLIWRRLWRAGKSAPSARRSPSAPARPATPSGRKDRERRCAEPRSRFCTCSTEPCACASKTAT